jgi:hypothetical protein
VAYIHWHYILGLLHQLTKEYNLYSLVTKIRSSVITEECILVSCSVHCFMEPNQKVGVELGLFIVVDQCRQNCILSCKTTLGL